MVVVIIDKEILAAINATETKKRIEPAELKDGRWCIPADTLKYLKYWGKFKHYIKDLPLETIQLKDVKQFEYAAEYRRSKP